MTEAVGGVWSVTITVRVTPVAEFPAVSVFAYVRVYVPRVFVFTEPERVNVVSRAEPEPSTLSVQEAQASVYVEP